MPERSRVGHASPMQVRLARIVILAILVGIGVSHVVFAIRDWPLGDMDVYLAAATRLREGDPLYVAGDVAVNSYWYAPWYAALWIPLTYLPREIVAIGWSLILLTATAMVTWLLAREGGTAAILALLVGPPLFAVSAGGNVQALLVLSLLYGIDRRSGPVWIALAASLRATPILFVAVYAARREWGRFWLTLGITALLVAPMLWYDPATLVSGVAGREPGLLAVSPWLFLVGVAVSVGAVAVLAWRRSPYTIIAAAAGTIVASPKLFAYDTAALLAVHPDGGEGHRGR